jgi:hypothetical protein
MRLIRQGVSGLAKDRALADKPARDLVLIAR